MLLPATVTNRLVTLAWRAPGNVAVGAYRLLVGSTPGGSNLAIFDVGPVTAFAATAPPGGLPRHRARDQRCGASTASNPIVVSVGELDPPANLTATVSGNQVALSWSAVAGAVSYLLEAGFAPGLSDAAPVPAHRDRPRPHRRAERHLLRPSPRGQRRRRDQRAVRGGHRRRPLTNRGEHPMTNDCTIPMLPLLEPYRTGRYLIYDYPSDTKEDHFRRGDDAKLQKDTFRASGSRQLDRGLLAARLEDVAKLLLPDGRLHLVDLRQETHLFFDNGRAVSWYGDKDWANVGRELEWIEADEQKRLTKIAARPTTRVFCLDPHNKEFASPTGYSEVTGRSAATEATTVAQLSIPVDYLRLPLTDHCPPTEAALDLFFFWCFTRFGPGDWVHFHCHGGDGRTTTFMALYNMVSWAMTCGTTDFPTIEKFAERQRTIFSYDLKPSACDPEKDWKCALAQRRWKKLSAVRDQIATGPCKDIADAKRIARA